MSTHTVERHRYVHYIVSNRRDKACNSSSKTNRKEEQQPETTAANFNTKQWFEELSYQKSGNKCEYPTNAF